mmetsp:Transcript_16598/g.34067  ORF Transcript_16598/g.34067 Transcript_16598/m.34067 type:complete len:260 (+) Transcript_16598:2-781(+)
MSCRVKESTSIPSRTVACLDYRIPLFVHFPIMQHCNYRRIFLVTSFAVVVSTWCQQQSLGLLMSPTSSLSKSLPLSTTTTTTTRSPTRMSAAATPQAISSLSPLAGKTSSSTLLSSEQELRDRLTGKRVALYFSAGWCPMCTSFEPALLSFRQAAEDSGKEVELVYVPSDRSDADALKRAQAMGMLSVSKEQAAGFKKEFKIWAGSETLAFGFGRRSGVPALVVLDNKDGKELAFLPAESVGPSALGDWPLDDESNGVW